MKAFFSFFLLSLLIVQCSNDDVLVNTPDPVDPEDPLTNELYFPPIDGSDWETVSVNDLGWNETEVANLYTYLETNNTRAFIVLKDGKIVLENYWGNNFLDSGPFTSESVWYWASADKTITSFLIGKAQEENYLSISEPTSDYLGVGWTSMDEEKEELITVKHQLNMTTGLDYTVDFACITPDCSVYKSDPGTEWFYNNGPYLLLKEVITHATGIDYKTYTDQKIHAATGMTGFWLGNDASSLYWSTARDMARFGLMISNDGKWDEEVLMNDTTFLNAARSSSQNLNPSYGYLWWLNGKNSIIYPGLTTSYNTELSPHAPDDLYAAMGKNGQFIDIVPSKNLVVVRMGQASDDGLVPYIFHDELWEKLNLVLND